MGGRVQGYRKDSNYRLHAVFLKLRVRLDSFKDDLFNNGLKIINPKNADLRTKKSKS